MKRVLLTAAVAAAPRPRAKPAIMQQWQSCLVGVLLGMRAVARASAQSIVGAWSGADTTKEGAGAAGQRWYTALAAFAPGLRSMPVTIYETTGGVFDTPILPGQKTVPVGTGTMAFQSCSAATFSYSFTGGSSSGLSGTINLSRVGPLPPGCTT